MHNIWSLANSKLDPSNMYRVQSLCPIFGHPRSSLALNSYGEVQWPPYGAQGDTFRVCELQSLVRSVWLPLLIMSSRSKILVTRRTACSCVKSGEPSYRGWHGDTSNGILFAWSLFAWSLFRESLATNAWRQIPSCELPQARPSLRLFLVSHIRRHGSRIYRRPSSAS